MSENQISSLKIVQPEDDKSTIMNNHDNSDGGARNKVVEMVSSKEVFCIQAFNEI